jgi:glycosidase
VNIYKSARLFFLIFTLSATSQSILAQITEVIFEVNMSWMAEQGRFEPTTEYVDIAGNFNNWGNPGNDLSDPNGDLIYTTSIQIEIGTAIAFKARINGEWLGREEFPGGGPNRTHTVTGNDTLRFWYNNETSADLLKARFSSDQVFVEPNSTVQFFDRSAGNPVEFSWSFPGGNPSSSTIQNPQVDYLTEGIFPVTLTVTDSAGNTHTTRHDRAVRVESTTTFWWNEAVFYEIFVRSFQDSDGDGVGDFNGLKSRLDYLNDGDPNTDTDLGIDAIWLMPIHPSPSYHGYDVTDYLGVNPDYGTEADFQRFIAEAHARGIKVIIDFVLNHSSDQHPYFIESLDTISPYRSYYVWDDNPPNVSGPWGQDVWHRRNDSYYYGLFWGGMPDLNFNNAQLKTEMFRAADFWLDEMGVDGFRLDAVKYIHEDSTELENTQATFQFWRDFQSSVTNTNPDVVTVGEAWTSTPEVVPYVEGNGLNFCFEFDLASALIHSVYHGSNQVLSDQMDLSYQSFPYLQFGSFLTNHDMNRIRDVFGNDLKKNALAAELLLTLPGIPFLYYGEEIGMNGIKPDPDIRTPMLWTDEEGAGFTTGQPWRSLNPDFRIKNVQSQQADTTSLWWTYRNSVALRNQYEALQTGRYLPVQSSYDSVFAFIRHNDTQSLLIVANLTQSTSPTTQLSYFSKPQDGLEWVNISSKDRRSIESKGSQKTVYIPAMDGQSMQVYVLDSVRTKPAGAQWALYPNPASEIIRIEGPVEGQARIVVTNALGQQVMNQQVNFSLGTINLPLNLKPGCYWLTIEGEEDSKTLPLIIGS